jgi:lysyl-tRNA synthetase class 2
MSSGSELINRRLEKLRSIRAGGYEPYPANYDLTHEIPRILESFSHLEAAELEAARQRVRTAGRMVSIRGHGKVSFAHLSQGGGRLQIYVRRDRVGPEEHDLFRLLDIGDFLGVEGELLRTRTGELTVFADSVRLLSKSVRPLPEKWHGLADVEVRYRQRYLDLMANPRVRSVFVRRNRIISFLRRFLEARGFLEVETPMMQVLAGGATARPFRTYHEALGIPLYLRIAPELYLKRLVVGGLDRVFEINRNFRNEGVSTRHNPEFTMLEFYQAYSDYGDLMDLTEEMLGGLVREVCQGLEVEYGPATIDFSSFQRYSMVDAIRQFWPGSQAPSAESLTDSAGLKTLFRDQNLEVPAGSSWDRMLGLLFETVAEKHLIQPTFIYDFPAQLSPLSKRKSDDPRFTERFELFAGGLELANAYSELNDPEEQRQRFREQMIDREQGNDEAHEMDEDYVRALEYGMPPVAGEGIGIDRLTMLLTNSPSIREVILFPHLRPSRRERGSRDEE